jgi:diguanylate cyclase (GGDEF)-like protein
LTYSDGSLFGTLCAIHPTPKPDSIANDLPLIELLASMLSGLLNTELKHLEATRSAELAAREAETDAMTGLYNRRGWNRLLTAEEDKCRRYGHSATVLAIDLNGLKTMNDSRGHTEGDKLICRAAQLIRASARSSDVVARTGGDEFAVLAAECDEWHARQLRLRIKNALSKGSVSASVGYALRKPSAGLHSAWEQADFAMYSEKTGARSGTAQHCSTIA